MYSYVIFVPLVDFAPRCKCIIRLLDAIGVLFVPKAVFIWCSLYLLLVSRALDPIHVSAWWGWKESSGMEHTLTRVVSVLLGLVRFVCRGWVCVVLFFAPAALRGLWGLAAPCLGHTILMR